MSGVHPLLRKYESLAFGGFAAVTMKCRCEARIDVRPVAFSILPSGLSCWTRYGAGVSPPDGIHAIFVREQVGHPETLP